MPSIRLHHVNAEIKHSNSFDLMNKKYTYIS